MTRALPTQAGVALIAVLLGISLVSAVAFGLVLSSSLVRLTAVNHDEAMSLANASEAALELAVRELGRVGDWNRVLQGVQASALTDGAPGIRHIAPGASIDLVRLTNRLTCGRDTACSDAQIRLATEERPWGANNPRWRLFVHQPLAVEPLPAPAIDAYVVVWIGDDAREGDGDPLRDGAGEGQAGRYIVRARSEAFGRRGGRHALEAELARVCSAEDAETPTCLPGIRVHSWRAVPMTPP